MANMVRRDKQSGVIFLNNKAYYNKGKINEARRLVFKKYIHFLNGGFYIPYSVGEPDYKVIVAYHDTIYKNGNAILENTRDDNAFRFGVFQNGYYTSQGSRLYIFGSWSAGEHTMIINDNGKNKLDGEIVCNYNTPSYFYSLIGVGYGNIENGTAEQKISPNTYLLEFKIESISTGNLYCHLKPALINNIPCMYDIINDVVYSTVGMEVFDEIPV